jgi:hypothetical protein
VKEASTGMRTSEPPEMVAQAFSGPGPTLGTKADMPAPGTEIGTAADPPLFGVASGSEKASQGAHTARTMESNHSEASTTPRAAAKGALGGGKILVASTGSGASSQSSASKLQKEWADTASSTGSGGGRKAQGENLTLAKLSK